MSPLDAGDVAQPVLLPVRRAEQLIGDVVERTVGAVLEDADFERPGLLLAAVHHGVLLADGREDRLGTDGEVGQRREAHVDVHHGRLLAEQRHLLHAADRHQRGLDPLRPVAQLGVGEALVGRKAVIDAVDVAEIIGHGDRRSAGRQPGFDVEHLAPQLVPELRDLGRGDGRIQFDQDLRKPVVGLRRDLVHAAHRLHFAFDRLGDELFDLGGRGARIGADERSALDDEDRVLLLAQREEPGRAAQQQDGQKEPDHLRIANGIFGEIHGRLP